MKLTVVIAFLLVPALLTAEPQRRGVAVQRELVVERGEQVVMFPQIATYRVQVFVAVRT